MQKLKQALACISGLLILYAAHAQPKLIRVEYYIDKDPGYGQATEVAGISGNDISNKTINVPVSALQTGVHVFGIRAEDKSGAWSLDNTWLFYKPDTAKKKVPNIVRIEYYIDKDPGYGKGIEVAIDNIKDYPNVDLFINISTLQAGKKHWFFIRSKDAYGSWSLDNVYEFTVGTAVSGPSVTAASISSKIVCAGGTVKVGYQAQGSFKPKNVFKIQMSDSLGNFGNSATIIGTIKDTVSSVVVCAIPPGLHGSGYKIRVLSTNPSVTSDNTLDSIIITTPPEKPVITADKNTGNVCPGDSVMLSSTPAASYLWNNGDTTQSITIDTAGSYTVTVFNGTGCGATSDTTKVTYQVCAKPGKPETSGITSTSAQLTWNAVNCAVKYKIQYRQANEKFVSVLTINNSYMLTGLLPGTQYEWRVQTICDKSNTTHSSFSKRVSFSTPTSGFAVNEATRKSANPLEATLFPNPAAEQVFVSLAYAKGPVQICVYDIHGHKLWASEKTFSHKVSIPISNIASGTYVVTADDGSNVVPLKLVKN